MSKEVVEDVYLHMVETKNNNVNKSHTIKNIISNLFETQEEKAKLQRDENMSTVLVKMIEGEELNAQLLIKDPDNKQTTWNNNKQNPTVQVFWCWM